MTVLRGLLAMMPLAGGGNSIHAVFRKPDVDRQRSSICAPQSQIIALLLCISIAVNLGFIPLEGLS